MTWFLLLLVGSIVGALYALLTQERRYRKAWNAVALPPVELGAGPYRRSSVAQHRARAPWLVLFAAFWCFWVGQSVALVVGALSISLWRGASASGTLRPEETMFTWRQPRLVYDLGALLLSRHQHAAAAATTAGHLLRMFAGGFVVVAGAALMRGDSLDVFFIASAFAAVPMLLTTMLNFLVRKHPDAFAPPVEA